MTAPAPFLLRPADAFGKPVCRLGLASHGETAITPDDIRHALDRGVNFLNWAGDEDVFSRTIAGLGRRRDDVVVCAQFGARTAAEAAAELRSVLSAIKSDYVDILTFYYVEEPAEWSEITGPGGALAYCRAARRDGAVRRLGVTTHQRPLAAEMARSGKLDLLMVRYNAAHRGVETEVFPAAEAAGLPVIAYTALRWRACSGRRPTTRPALRRRPPPCGTALCCKTVP